MARNGVGWTDREENQLFQETQNRGAGQKVKLEAEIAKWCPVKALEIILEQSQVM